jgi:hypothetical protein
VDPRLLLLPPLPPCFKDFGLSAFICIANNQIRASPRRVLPRFSLRSFVAFVFKLRVPSWLWIWFSSASSVPPCFKGFVLVAACRAAQISGKKLGVPEPLRVFRFASFLQVVVGSVFKYQVRLRLEHIEMQRQNLIPKMPHWHERLCRIMLRIIQ